MITKASLQSVISSSESDNNKDGTIDSRSTSKYTYTYDEAGRRISEISDSYNDSNGDGTIDSRSRRENRWTYDGAGNQLPLSSIEEYDNHGDGTLDSRSAYEYTYDEAGRKTSEVYDRYIDSDEDETIDYRSRSENRWTYDEAGNQLPLSSIDKYDSNGDGTLDSRSAYEYTYDEAGRKISEVHDNYNDYNADGTIDFRYRSEKRWTYDGAGNQLSYESDDNGDGTIDSRSNSEYTYDGAGRKTSEVHDSYSDYNSDGMPDRSHSESRWTYDGAGNQLPLSEVYESDNDGDGTLDSRSAYEYTYTYDEAGRKISEVHDNYNDYNADGTIDFRYRSEKRWTYDGAGNQLSYESDDNGDGTIDSRSNSEYTYDGAGRKTSEIHDSYSDYNGDGDPDSSYRSESRWTYDGAGNQLPLFSVYESDYNGDGTLDSRSASEYTYDEAGRKTSEVHDSYDRHAIGWWFDPGRSHSESRWTYDEAGNQLPLSEVDERDIDGDGTLDSRYAYEYAYDEAGRKTSEVYDKYGPVWPRQWDSGRYHGEKRWTYDGAGRKISEINEGYSDDNRDGTIDNRSRSETRWTYDEAGNQLTEVYESDDNGDGTIDSRATSTNTYIYYSDNQSLVVHPVGRSDNCDDLTLIIPTGSPGLFAGANPNDPSSLEPSVAPDPHNAFSLGSLDFEITGLPFNGMTEVQILLPSGGNINNYLALIDGSWQSCLFNGTTGAEFRDLNDDGTEDIVFHLQDGGREDTDGTDGVVKVFVAPTTTTPGPIARNGVFSAETSADTTLLARWLFGSTEGNYEFGSIAVDDALGRIDGIAPDSENYASVALARKNVIFTGRSDASATTLTHDSVTGDFGASESADIGQLQTVTIHKGFTIFYLTENGRTTFSVNSQDKFSNVADGRGYNQLSFIDSRGQEVRFELETPNFITPGIVGHKVTVEVELKRVAEYSNFFGLYPIDDLTGGLDTDGDGSVDLLTGHAGYAREALQRAKSLPRFQAPANYTSAKSTVELDAGKMFGMFIIPNASIDDVLTQNPDNTGGNDRPISYFSFSDANPDGLSHMIRLGNAEKDIFGFEDLFGNTSDRDYNDLIVSISIDKSSLLVVA